MNTKKTLADAQPGGRVRLGDAQRVITQQWQPIETAPTGKLVVVGWLDDEDVEHPERHEFDYIEEGAWVHHAELVEHAQAVAPPGSRMPKEQPPYQWWMDLPDFSAALSAQPSPGVAVPAGWKLVPIEPNWDMRNEGREFLIDGIEKEPERLAYFLWKTMINAAPEVQ